MIHHAAMKFDKTKVIYSELLPRQDIHGDKINRAVRQNCRAWSNVHVIQHENIRGNHLFVDPKHLNIHGVALSVFCEQWKMQVHLKKTKIMVFQKKCRKSFNPSFSYKKDVIPKLNDYTYLGIKITSTGNFALAEETLKEKALRALYASKILLNFSMLRPKIAEKLFDTLVKPIVLYNSEVWSAYSKGDFGSWDKSPAEKVHLRFCKIYLGVNSKCRQVE